MNWSEVSVLKYQQFYEFITDPVRQTKDLELYDLNAISFFEDLPIDEVENMFFEDYRALRKKYAFARQDPPPMHKDMVETKAGPLHFIQDFNRISIGEYIDLNELSSQGFVKNLSVIMAIIYRKKLPTDPLLFNDSFEKYGDYIYRRASLFEELPVTDVFGVVNKYKIYKTQFQKTFSSLISEREESPSTEDLDKMDRRERLELEQDLEHQKAREQFSWDLFLYNLSKLNNCTFEQATELPATLAFGMYSMKQAFKL